MHLPNGTLLQGGKYKIVRFISSGGFGCTYEAEHVMLKKRVAIKEFFVKDFCNREESTAHVTVGTISKRGLVDKLRNKFVDEARALSSLQHPNIVRVSDVFEENGTAYFVMDFIEGSSLSEILKREGHLSEQRALKYIRQVADALHYVHANNRLHLDVKPSNIMIDKQDNAVLIDFGASKQYDEADGENTSTLMGKTPGYAPLEQMGNDVVKFTPSTDIYALGATLYKLITGVTPPSSNLLATGDTLAPLSDTISPNVATAISVAMRTKRTERPQSIDEFLAIINNTDATTGEDEATAIDSKPKQPHVSSSQKEPQPKKGKPFPIKTVAVVVCLVIAIVGFGVYLNNRDSDDKKAVQTEDTTDLKEDVKHLYIDLLEAGYTVKEVGTLEQFNYAMANEDIRRNIYNHVNKEGKVDIGTYTEYETKYGMLSNPYYKNAIRHTQNVDEVQNLSRNTQATANTDIINGHEYVDLGVGVKWATCNIGANSPSDYGDYFAWGEIKPKSEYTQKNSITRQKKMNGISSNPKYDAATANWGDSWRLPTSSEINKLIKNCEWTWISLAGQEGYMITGPNGNSIFLPAAGVREGTSRDNAGDLCSYWCATPDNVPGTINNNNTAYCIGFRGGNLSTYSSVSDRYKGLPIRPVSD